MRFPLGRTAVIVVIAALAACGNESQKGLPPSSQYAAKCATPRSGIDPSTGNPFRDTAGSTGDEKIWLRAWTDELYLWYREVPNVNPTAYATPIDYFAVLKTPAITASGKPKDQYHYTYPTAEWRRLAQSGVRSGYGVQWAILASSPPRRVVAAYNEPGSPAALAGVGRGVSVLTVDGEDLSRGNDVAKLNAGLFPSASGEAHTFVLADPDGRTRTVELVSANVESAPVQNVRTLSGGVGYMLFNDHHATAEAALVAAVTQLQSGGIADLVLDIRYNSGGYVDIASELAYMIAGPTATQGKTFEKNRFNDKYPTNDPVSGAALELPFHASTRFSMPAGQSLPHLDLPRVFVLTGGQTCSASEAIINSLRGIDVGVIQIGSTSCGKPYGFYPRDNCGTTYFSVQFQGVNAKGFGDYDDGFVPGGNGAAGLPGCRVADDFAHELGDPAEARLAAALWYRANQTCPPSSGALQSGPSLSAEGGRMVKSPWDENRIYRR